MNKQSLISNANESVAKGNLREASLLFKKAFELDQNCGHTLLAYLKICLVWDSSQDILSIISQLGRIDKRFESAGLLYYELSLARPSRSFDLLLLEYSNTWSLFHSGSEVDWLFWNLGGDALVKDISVASDILALNTPEAIPRNLFYYFDNPELPEDVNQMVSDSMNSGLFNVRLFNKETARTFLTEEYGLPVLSLFDSLRHPSEESDFIRFHAVYKYGGFWSDVDEKLDQKMLLNILARLPYAKLFVSQSKVTGGPLQSCFFGGVSDNPILERCIEILYKNCNDYPNLSMWLKTGPGPLTRAVFEAYTKSAIEQELERPEGMTAVLRKDTINIIGAHELRLFLKPYEPSYRNDARDWRVFESENSNN